MPSAPSNVQVTPLPKSNDYSGSKPIPPGSTTTLAPGPTTSPPTPAPKPPPEKLPPVVAPSPGPIADPRPPAPANQGQTGPVVAKLDPSEIRSQLEQKLRAAKYDLSVAVSAAGVVTLTGVVENQKQMQDALRLAKELPGVIEVKSQINSRDIWR